MSQKTNSAFVPRKRARLDQATIPHSGSDQPYHNIVCTSDVISLKQVLARVDELEGKCAQLETKCKSLEDELRQQRHHSPAPSSAEAIVASIVSHIDSKFHTMESAINSKLQDLDHSSRWLESLHRNREWKYSAPTIPISYWTSRGFDEEYAEYADSFLEDIETVTCAMMRGECTDSFVHLGFRERFDDADTAYLQYDESMQSHWQEFVQALSQYHWFLNRSSTGHCESTLIVSDIQIPSELCYLLEKVLPLNHFRRLTFQNNQFGSFGISMAIKCIEKNPKLVEFILAENEIESTEDADKLCQAVNAHPVLEIFSLKGSCGVVFHDIIHGIMHDNCKLECIDLPNNGIRTNGSTHIADFLAKNPPLRELTLENNHLNDDDAEAIAEALKTNTKLKTLIIRENDITERGEDALKKVTSDFTSLNSAAACNHSCKVYLDSTPENCFIEETSDPKVNRGYTLYRMLNNQDAEQNAHRLGTKVNIPVAIESIQKYAKYSLEKSNGTRPTDLAPALSIIYGIIRNKATELYSPQSRAESTTMVDVELIPCVSNE